MMMYIGKTLIGASAKETLMIGDRMDTDMIGGMEAGMKTCLVLSGVTSKEDLEDFPYRPDYILGDVGEIDIEKM